jgi:uncharacterized protein YjbJ (UPF0337 family)/low affinity Fe/Cu permease
MVKPQFPAKLSKSARWQKKKPSSALKSCPFADRSYLSQIVTVMQHEKMMDKDRIEGTGKQVKGSAKETVGKVAGDKETEARGAVEKTAGKVQSKVGKAKDVVRETFKRWRSTAYHPARLAALHGIGQVGAQATTTQTTPKMGKSYSKYSSCWLLTRIGVVTAHPGAFLIWIASAVCWLIFQPETLNWHGVATLATWCMALFIQRAEHRDTQAIYAKLDELLRAEGRARNKLTRLDDEELEEIEEHRENERRCE